MAFDVFLSHSTKDRPVVEQVLAALESDGVTCWMAPRNIILGSDWTEQIENAIKESQLLLLFLSPSSNASPEVKREVQLAADRRMIIAPVVLGTTKPAEGLSYTLARAHRIAIAESPSPADVRRVVEAVRAALKRKPIPSPSPVVQRRRPWLPVAIAAVVGLIAFGAWQVLKSNAGTGTASPKQSPQTATPLRLEVPGRLSKLPAAPVLKLIYESTPAASDAVEPPRSMSVGILARRKGQQFAPLNDGEPLASEADEYVIGANTPSGGYLYIFQVDSRGKVDPLFPKVPGAAYSSGENPIAPGDVAQAPGKESNTALTLDRNAGVEHVYFVLTASRWVELEQLLKAAPEPPAANVILASVTEPNAIGFRGVGGVVEISDTPEVEMTLFSKQEKVASKGRLVRATGSVLVIERWFRHVPG